MFVFQGVLFEHISCLRYVVFRKYFFEPRVQERKKNTGKPSYRKPAGTLAKKKKKRFFPITKCNLKNGV